MGKITLLIVLIALISAAIAYEQRSKEHIKNRENMLRNVDTFAELFRDEYRNFTLTGLRSDKLNSMMQIAKFPTNFARMEPEDLPPDEAIMSCVACRTSIGFLLQQYRTGVRTKEEITQDAIDLCMQLTTYGIEVCTGIVVMNAVGLKPLNLSLKINIKFLPRMPSFLLLMNDQSSQLNKCAR